MVPQHFQEKTDLNDLKEVEARKLLIAIDGPAGAGKSTVAKLVADRLNYLYIDTGAMYRAITWLALKNNLPIDAEVEITKLAKNSTIELVAGRDKTASRVLINGTEISKEIRTAEISRLVSPLSAFGAIREIMVEKQRELAKAGGAVLDGRDIGTVVLPFADVKIFLTASSYERARRRLQDLQAIGQTAIIEQVLADIEERDQRDSTRAIAPLKAAEDAHVVDTDELSIEQVVDKILSICLATIKNPREPRREP